MTSKSAKTGFTLIELLIVIVILGILTTLVASSFVASQRKGRDARRKEDLHNVTRALEAFYNDKGRYPTGSADGQIMACGADDNATCAWGDPMLDSRGTYYMPQLPVDPNELGYFYVSTSGEDYQLYARLENARDRDIAKINGEAAVYEGTTCSIYVCNYGVASTNSSLANIVPE